MWKSPFSYLGAGLQEQRSGEMKVGERAGVSRGDGETGENLSSRCWAEGHKRFPNREAEDGLELRERLTRRVSLLVK